MSTRRSSLLAEDGRSVKVVAGSQSLGPMLNMRLVQPDLLVDITGIDELRQVKEEADGVVIGACVTHSDIEDRPRAGCNRRRDAERRPWHRLSCRAQPRARSAAA